MALILKILKKPDWMKKKDIKKQIKYKRTSTHVKKVTLCLGNRESSLMISRSQVPEVCSIYPGVSFAYHATPPWTCEVWRSYLVYQFFWLLWKVYAYSAFVLLLSFLTETLVYFHLLNLLGPSRFPPCFVLFHFSLPQFPCVPPWAFLHLQARTWPFFLVHLYSVLFVEWSSLSLALSPYFFLIPNFLFCDEWHGYWGSNLFAH